MNIVVSILIMLLILTILVIVHEWGHYIAARIFGVTVNEFSIFMGPKIFSRVGKKRGTVFSIRCLPLGGYCAMEGEETTEETAGAFCNKPWWQRTIILLAGVFMNIVLAIVVMTVIFMIYGYETRKVSVVSDYMPMAMVGLEVGDSITNYNGYSIYNPLDFNLVKYADGAGDSEFTIKKANGTKEKYKLVRDIDETAKTAEIQIYAIKGKSKTHIGTYRASWADGSLVIDMTREDRSGEKYAFKKSVENEKDRYVCVKTEYDQNSTVLSVRDDLYNEETVQNQLAGFDPYKYGLSFSFKKGNLFETMGNAVTYNVSLVKSVFNSLKWLFTGRLGMEAMSGPIGLTTVVEDIVTENVGISSRIVTLLQMAALISANLAAFNILPIPGLDGGKLIFIIIELIRRGKKVPPEKEAVVSLIFLALLILFSLFVAGNDILRIIKS
ncbi:MAG: RIP metalloprotease RseP [Clostridia bacterium]